MPPGSMNHEPYTDFFSIIKGVRTLGGTPLYKRYVPPQTVGFLGPFGLKTLCPFWSGIGYGFRGNYGSVHVWKYLSFQFQMNKNEIEIYEFEMRSKNSFLFAF